jgi:protein-disulfide isomerase
MVRPIQRFLILAAVVGATASFACGAATGEPGKGGDKGAKKKDAATSAVVPATASRGQAAVIGDTIITFDQLDAKAAGALMKVRQDEYDIRRQALDGLINEQLMDKEAAAKGVTREKLLETEVNAKVAEPAKTAVDAFYEENKARFGTQTKEQVAPQIAAMLRSQQMGEAQRDYLKGLRDKYGVKVMMDPPRVEVSLDDDAIKGPENAPITIVEFSDYQCPYCSRAETTVLEVLKKYGDKVRFVYRDYPLSFHPNAENAAIGAGCAKDQGKFWEMHGAMFANQNKLAKDDLVATAAGLGMDKDKFKACLDAGKYKDEVQKDFQDGQKYGVTGTPTFFINGIMMVGARDVNSFAEIISQEMERKN